MSAPLSMDVLEGRVVTCLLQGARFDVTTGKPITRGHLGGMAGAVVKRTKMGKVMDAGRTPDRRGFEVVAEDGSILRVIP